MAEEKKRGPGRPKKERAGESLELPAAIESLPPEKKGGGGVRDLTADENISYVQHEVDAINYPTVDIYNEEQVAQRFRLYVASCKRNNQRMTPPGLASWLGISTEELKDWMIDPGSMEHRRLAARIYEVLRASWADYAMSGKTPASIAIFVAKNWFAMSDVNRVESAPIVQKALDLEKLAAEAAALPDGDVYDA